MAKNDNKPKTPAGSDSGNVAEYYELKTEAVDRLVNASEETAPEVSDEEIAKVSGRRNRWNIPNIVKVLFIKWWFAGAICFFFYFGLGTVITSTLDLLFVFGAALGVLTDLITNNILRFIEKTPGQNNRYMMVTTRKYWSLFINVIYAYVILYCVVTVYNVMNYAIVTARGVEDSVAIGVEPILFGLFYLGLDSLFIAMKRLLKKIVSEAESKVKSGQ